MEKASIHEKASQAYSDLITLAGNAGLTSLGMGLIIPVLPLYARSLGASITLVELLLASLGATSLLANLPAIWFPRRVGDRRLLIYSPAIAASLFLGWITDRDGVGSNLRVLILAFPITISLFVGLLPIYRS